MAYDEYMRGSNSPLGDEYIVVRICYKIKKHGIVWTVGELADYQLKSDVHLKN
jgi:hypothetical protein